MTAKYDLRVQVDLRPLEWMRQAACKDHPNPDLWFPDLGQNATEAKAICAECPVRKECAEYGMSERWGIWGGLSYKQKTPQRRKANEGKCRNGHNMTPENEIWITNGNGCYRYCRKCRQKTAAKHYRKKAYQ